MSSYFSQNGLLYGSCDIKVGKPERLTNKELMVMRNLLDLRERKVLRMIFFSILISNLHSWMMGGNICSYKEHCNAKWDVDCVWEKAQVQFLHATFLVPVSHWNRAVKDFLILCVLWWSLGVKYKSYLQKKKKKV